MSQPQHVTIMMIEDDPGHARLIENSIRQAAISNTITHLRDGASALDYLVGGAWRHDRAGPALILLDLNLADMSGIEILARIKETPALNGMPVIVLTGSDNAQEMERCYELGCNVFITKPLNYESFSNAIRQLGLFLAVMQLPVVQG